MPLFPLTCSARRGPDGAVTGIMIHLKHGERLISCDSNGFSDPYVKFKLGKYATRKSETIPKTLNPKWLQEFFIPCPDG